MNKLFEKMRAAMGKLHYVDYALVPVFLAVWLYTWNILWLAFAAISLVTAVTKPLPRFQTWLQRRLIRSYSQRKPAPRAQHKGA